MKVGVVGASGFIGRAVCAALERREHTVVRVPAPRLATPARNLRDLLELELSVDDRLVESLSGCEAVVNAAGVSNASGDGDRLYGANALLPMILARAVNQQPMRPRFVHVSSSSVQGRISQLDESPLQAPFSPYSRSKALGETGLRVDPEVNAVVFRPTSVHGQGRDVTRRLVALCSSRLASVASEGGAPTPQVLVENVGDAIAFVSTLAAPTPAIVLQPSEGLTASELVRLLGEREPIHVPRAIANCFLIALRAGGVLSPWVRANARRLEMLWCGQDQVRGWLRDTEWVAPVGRDGWRALR